MEQRGKKIAIKGVVVSSKMDKTIVVRVQRLVKHAGFHKFVRRYMKYKENDEQNSCKMGDKVLIVESRPVNHEKRFWLVKKKKKAK